MEATARRTYFESMMRLGFTMLRLHKVDADGVADVPFSRVKVVDQPQAPAYPADALPPELAATPATKPGSRALAGG